MAEIVISVASKVAEYLVAPLGRQCGYVIFTDSYVGQLEEEIEKLDDMRVGVQRSVDDADNNMREITREVNRWKNNAETVANEARSVLDNDGRAKKTCFCGWLPNPKGRYCLGRNARKTAQAIQELIPQGKFERVYYESAPPGLVGGAAEVNSSACDGGDTIQELIPLGQFENPLPGLVGGAPDMNLSAGGGGDTITDSRASIFQDIMKALDDEKLKVVGVYGPGGVGKTTLLKKVEEKLRKEGGPFQMIVKAEVLQTPDLNNIQGQIADALKLDLKDKQSQQGRRDHLLQRLQKDPNEKVLIILDDLWHKLDLKAVGIPSGDESRGCKLLLTSRYRDVLEQRMCADRTFLLRGLEDEEAFRLFEKIVGDKLKDEELKAIAAQVVKKLAGLPLLITSVARTLQYSQPYAWRNALIKIEDSDIKSIVKLSYDHLTSEDAKSLFLLCGLIGGTIQVEILLVLGMGLGLFEGYNKTIKDSRDRLNTMLDSLRSICLLQDGGDDKENVTIHDLYSEVVVSTPIGGQNSLMMNSNYGSWSKEKLEKYWAICLADVDKDRLDKLMTCQFPDLKLLMLSQPKDEGWMREHKHEVGDCSGLLDFTYMKELRILYFHSMHIHSLPPSIGILGNLHSLYLDRCNVKDVAILGKLKALQILSFTRSAISRLPKEIGGLTNLRSLNLRECYKFETIDPGVLKGLTNLEELNIYSFSRWMGKEISSESCNARLAELKSLTKLTALEINIHDPTILLKDGDLPFLNLDRFLINIGLVVGEQFKYLRVMKLKLKDCESILSKEWIQKSLQKTQCLHLCKLSEFKKSAHELCTQGFEEVKYINIEDSPSIMYIANSSDGLPLTAFRTLESLILRNLIKLEKICNGLITPESFSKLRAINVQQCDRLKYLWCLSDRQRLVQLEEIDVGECNSMQSIVTHDAGEGIVSTDNRVELPNVRCLRLCELPNMMSFCTKVEITSKDTPIQVSLPRLESLVMVGLLGLEKILYSEHSLKYSNLRSLMIKKSKSTSKSLMKLDWILKLPNLESMSLLSSPSAEVVFDLEELKVIGDVEILSCLTKLTLDELPNLQHLWKQDVKLQGISILRNLRRLYVYKTGLSFLFSVSVAKCFREIRAIAVEDCPNMKALIVDEGRNEGTYDIIEFPLLEYLCIRQCPMEKFFSYPCGKKELVITTSDSQDANCDSFFDRKVTFPNITTMEIIGLPCEELWNNQIPTDSFQKLEHLSLIYCDNLQRVAPSYMWKRLQCYLKILKVMSCPSIEIIYEGDGTDTETSELRRLILKDLKNLRCIWQSDGLPNIPFPNMRDVEAVRCPHLEMLFPNFTAKFLWQIEELVVESCEDMELIAGHENWEEATGTTITFSKLTALRLFKLPKFRSFLPEKYSLKFSCSEDFPSLQVLSIKSCGAEPDQVLGNWRHHKVERAFRKHS